MSKEFENLPAVMEVLPSGPRNIENQLQEQNKIILPC